MGTKTITECDVFHVDDWPRVGLDDVQSVELVFKTGERELLRHRGVMCAKARQRTLGFINRALKPPAQREKSSGDA